MPESRNASTNNSSNFSNTSNSDDNVESQEPKPLIRASTTFYERVITDWWWWELGSWFVSFACVTTIVALLFYYDGKKQPNHVVKGITLNAFIAVFAAVAKAALILPVSEAIGQLKWIWFRKERKLFDFYAFDNASRGPWGSAVLLCTTKGRHLVSVGAAITVLALAFEPFFQQSVSYPSRTIITGSGSVSIAISYNAKEQTALEEVGTWSTGAKNITARNLASKIANTLADRREYSQAPPSVCPTGRCTWAPYSSLGVCHRCQDISQLLQPVCQIDTLSGPGQTSGFQYPCGYRFNSTLVTGVWGYWSKTAMGLSTMMVGSERFKDQAVSIKVNSTAFRNASSVLLDFYIAFVPGGDPRVFQNATPVLQNCIYQWCVKTYEAFHTKGRLEETILSTYLPPDTQGTRSSPNNGFVMTAAGKTFSVGAYVSSDLAWSISASLPVSLTNTTLDSSGQYPGRWNFVHNAPYDVDTVLGPIADTVTNFLRDENTGVEQVSGDAWGPEPYVETQWLWILLPCALLLSTLILICGTIIKSRKDSVPSWKSSALATLLHGLTEEVREQFEANASQSEVEAIAQKIQIKISLKESSGALVAADSSVGHGCIR
ncbi:hypothetical protein CC86DRAFT_429958 [Ophiobolus disseminans]|uniref:DUF3176 domain containing protein n=1 Tax=Ophiobolus disseminans TaxID=1469910 RepID=A0A6A6ZF56_9PLEO|nr:hypothetical protein CC86DRAFT_429958 [Ophiobolus disseminans]